MNRNFYFEQAEADLYRLHWGLSYWRESLSFRDREKLA